MQTWTKRPRAIGQAFVALSFALASLVHGNEPSARDSIDQAFRDRLGSLAAKCDELGLARCAQTTRAWCIERDPERQYFLSPGSTESILRSVQGEPPDLVEKWLAKLIGLRRDYAAQLFQLASDQAAAEDAPTAYRLLHETLREDPHHAQARRILGRKTDDETRPRARVARLPHPRFGWPRGKWWQIESTHFSIVTNDSSEAGLELARRLERFHELWRQLFFSYWSTPQWLNGRFAGDTVIPPAQAKHQVVLFRSRDEYVRQLGNSEPQIAMTLGYYQKSNRTSYFYSGTGLMPVVYHEATHQLFQEIGEAQADVGEKWNFWAIEGVAVYMESVTEFGDYSTVGGFDSDRLQFVRSRVLGGEPQMPLPELVRLGRNELQQHPDIRRIYTHSAGVVHFLMDYERGACREPFIRYLTKIYLGRDSAESFQEIEALDAASFQKSYEDFLMVDDQELKFLGPPEHRRNLSLIRARISNESLSRLAGSDRLEWLDLSYTPVTSAGLATLASLGNLQRLSLVGVSIDDQAVEALTRCQRLDELDLSGTRITDAAMPGLATMTKLKVLRLSHTRVSDAGMEHLRSLKLLEELDVDETDVTSAALARLKTQLPKLE